MGTNKKSGEKNYRWYVEPRDGGHTNSVLAAELGSFSECAERNFWDGERRKAWEAPDYNFVANLQKGKREQNLDFLVYVQEDNGKLRPWPFDAAKRKHKPRKKKAA